MPSLPRFVSLGLVLVVLGACGRPASIALHRDASRADADVPPLLAQRDAAVQRAHTVAAQVILRQVDVAPPVTLFRFTDGTTTQEITVVAPHAAVPASQWNVLTTTVSPLVGHPAPDLPLHDLLVGPTQVTDVLVQQWPECREPSATLFLDEGTLTWRALCTLATGVIDGEVDARSGAFTPGPPPSIVHPATSPLPSTP
jgi:hypothetical protein